MSDLTESEIQTWLSTKPARLGDTMQDFYRLLYEVQRHRAAQTASKERVMEVVAAAAAMTGSAERGGNPRPAADAPPPGRGGHDWREGTAMADVEAAREALDRLLGAKP